MKKLSSLLSTLTSPLLQSFSGGETNFYFCQFFSNFLKCFALNCLLFYLYNIFAIYFPGKSSPLQSLFSIISNFSCFHTSILSLFSNFATTSFAFFKFSSLFYMLYSTVNSIHYTKYFTTPLTFL